MARIRLSWTKVSLSLLLLGLAPQASASMNAELLRADFNDKPLNTQISTGGASVGEPVSLSPGLLAVVKATPLSTPSITLGEFVGGEKDARFEFINGEEIHSGELRISFVIRTPSALDNFRVLVSERSGSASSFGGVRLRSNGNISTLDANPTSALRTWSPDEILHFELVYQVAAGTYDLFINGVQELDDRAHGDPLIQNGIGAVSFGFPDQPGALEWVVDDIHVVRTPALLNADFDDRPINMQIGIGGPTVGEPISINPELTAIVETGHFATPALMLEQSDTGPSKGARFEFVNSREVTDDELRISYRVLAPPIADAFVTYIREQERSTLSFGSLQFQSNGTISAQDANGDIATASSYMPGDTLLIEHRYALAAGTYDIYVNRVLALDDRPHGIAEVGRGVGAVILSTQVSTTSQWVFDDLYVYQPGVIFQDGFD